LRIARDLELVGQEIQLVAHGDRLRVRTLRKAKRYDEDRSAELLRLAPRARDLRARAFVALRALDDDVLDHAEGYQQRENQHADEQHLADHRRLERFEQCHASLPGGTPTIVGRQSGEAAANSGEI
jgi:hypothetical protein